jgi:hypothetical protein
VSNQGEVYAQFVAAELEQERKRRELLDTRATATIAASAALIGLAVAVGIFDPGSLSKQQPAVLGGVFLLGASLTGTRSPARRTWTSCCRLVTGAKVK